MSTQSHYDAWSETYDQQLNKTRDLEGQAVRSLLGQVPFSSVLEIGAGTGKNTVWYAGIAERLVAVDLSEGMLAQAREKVAAMENAGCTSAFVQADVTQPWDFGEGAFDLVAFSLVLEHIAELGPVFVQAAAALRPGGRLYLGELHPFKQYHGSKARYETAAGTVVVDCHVHHVGDFVAAAQAVGLHLAHLQEHWDGDDRSLPPRILAMVFRKA